MWIERQYRGTYRYAVLVRDDDGRDLGCVMQFNDGHAAYPVGRTGRYGAYETFDAAKQAVESMEK